MRRALLTAGFLGMALCGYAQQPPATIAYQGLLTDNTGTPIDGTKDLTLRLFDALSGGTQVWSRAYTNVVIDEGLYALMLEGGTPALETIAFDRPLWLEVVVVTDGVTLLPRTALAMVPYAQSLRNLRVTPETPAEGPNMIGGAADNTVAPGVVGATISGGGDPAFPNNPAPNKVLGNYGTVGGGALNTAGDLFATVGGGISNNAGGSQATIGGGTANAASNSFATVGGGQINQATGLSATVSGGSGSTASGVTSTVSGGQSNSATDESTTVSGGTNNTATAIFATVSGGNGNSATGPSSTVSGGSSNSAAGQYATVPGGFDNSAADDYSFAAGYKAKANHEGTFVWNDRSITTGNDSLLSTGPNQFLIRADGGVGIGTDTPVTQLTVNGDADFSGPVGIGTSDLRAPLTVRGPDDATDGPIIYLYGDASNQAESGRIRFVESTTTLRGAYIRFNGDNAVNQFQLGVNTGGAVGDDKTSLSIDRNSAFVGVLRPSSSHPIHVGDGTGNGNGAHVTAGGIWTNGSSRSFKQDFAPIDRAAILEEVARLPITRWRYRGVDEAQHIGPMAEDFYEAFGLGSDANYIGTVDADGVALAAIQALYRQNQQLQAMLETLQHRIEALERTP